MKALFGNLYRSGWTTMLMIILVAGCNKDNVGIPPRVTVADQVSKATLTGFDSKISATFNVAMDPSTINNSTFLVKNGNVPVSGSVKYSAMIATFTPAVDLDAKTIYTATITSGAKSVTGNSMQNDYVWGFTTLTNPDNTAPVVLSTDPSNSVMIFDLNHVIVAKFSEAMDQNSINSSTFTLRVVGSSELLPGSVTHTSTTASFTPANNLTLHGNYTATITAGVKDIAGNPMIHNLDFNFSTCHQPLVISTTPANLAFCIPLNSVVTATFSGDMDPLSVISSFSLKLGQAVVPGVVTYSGVTATFTPNSNLLADGNYTATISTGALNDEEVALAQAFVWSFGTIGCLHPCTPPVAAVVDLKTAGNYGILAGVAITNVGSSVIKNEDVGISPGLRVSVTGFPPAVILNGALYASDDLAPPGGLVTQAKADLTAAYLVLEGLTSPTPVVLSGDQGGKTLGPGIYKSTSTLLIQQGDLTLDGGSQCDSDAIWVFQVGSALTTIGGAGGNVLLINGAQAKNVYWQVTSSATIGDGTAFKGNVLALTSITLNSNATVIGRLLARNGAVSLISTGNIIKP